MARFGAQLFHAALAIEGELRALLYGYARNPADVDELLQEAYLRMLNPGLAQQAAIRDIRSFARTVVRNVALDWLRHRKVIPLDLTPDVDLDIADETARVEDQVSAAQELARVAAAMQHLPEQCRAILVLRRVHERSQKDIAELLQIPERVVSKRLARARRLLDQLLFSPEPDGKPAPRLRADGVPENEEPST